MDKKIPINNNKEVSEEEVEINKSFSFKNLFRKISPKSIKAAKKDK